MNTIYIDARMGQFCDLSTKAEATPLTCDIHKRSNFLSPSYGDLADVFADSLQLKAEGSINLPVGLDVYKALLRKPGNPAQEIEWINAWQSAYIHGFSMELYGEDEKRIARLDLPAKTMDALALNWLEMRRKQQELIASKNTH